MYKVTNVLIVEIEIFIKILIQGNYTSNIVKCLKKNAKGCDDQENIVPTTMNSD